MMKAHLVQLDIQWESPEANFTKVRSLIESVSPTPGDLIALPELFDSGFSLNIDTTQDSDNKTLNFLRALATEYNCIIQGSRTIVPAKDQLAFNCATILSPESGTPLCEYHKIHPFSMGNEPQSFQGGHILEQYTWGEAPHAIKVCPAICYDLRFPELFRKGAIDGAEMFVLGANWPSPRQHHWRALLIARAIENQAFVLGINRCGLDPYLQYNGGTIAISPKGDILGELENQESVLSVEIDPDVVHQWRSQFPAINDIKIRSLDTKAE